MLSYEGTICVALRTNHCIETKPVFKRGPFFINLLPLYFLSPFTGGTFHHCPTFVLLSQQRRTKVFHFLTYHKVKQKTFKQDVSSTAASSRPSSLSLATILVTFYRDNVFEFAVFIFIYLHIYVVEFTSFFGSSFPPDQWNLQCSLTVAHILCLFSLSGVCAIIFFVFDFIFIFEYCPFLLCMCVCV